MGRLPSEFAKRVITQRIPYNMPGELILRTGQTGQQFPDATFANNIDKPFEIHRVKPWITALDSQGVALVTQPDQDLLQALVRVQVNDLGKNTLMTKAPTLVHLLTKGTSERTWEWADPYYIIRSEFIQVTADALTFPAIGSLDSLRLEWDFQGYLVVIAPPSESR